MKWLDDFRARINFQIKVPKKRWTILRCGTIKKRQIPRRQIP